MKSRLCDVQPTVCSSRMQRRFSGFVRSPHFSSVFNEQLIAPFDPAATRAERTLTISSLPAVTAVCRTVQPFSFAASAFAPFRMSSYTSSEVRLYVDLRKPTHLCHFKVSMFRGLMQWRPSRLGDFRLLLPRLCYAAHSSRLRCGEQSHVAGIAGEERKGTHQSGPQSKQHKSVCSL